MTRFSIWFLFCVLYLGFCISCGDGSDKDNESTYLIKGTVALDSTWVTDGKLVLFADNHRSLQIDTIQIANDGTFQYEGQTNGLDELYLCGDQGEICRLYASADMEVDLSIVSAENGDVKVQFLSEEKDSINLWLDDKRALFDNQESEICRSVMDSLVRMYAADIRISLLLRESMTSLDDSLYIRQSLGSIKDEAKPDWIKKSIDNILREIGPSRKVTNKRLQGFPFEMQDTLVDLSTSRSDYLLILVWADYSKPSIDSLREYARLIHSEYENKRVSFMSCCLHADDSAMWRIRTKYLDGKHTWIKGGFSDARMRAWEIKEAPSIILMDMYCNQLQRNVWGADMRKALDRLPNRIGLQKKTF